MNTETQFSFMIDSDLLDKLRIHCRINHVTMKSYMAELITKELDDNDFKQFNNGYEFGYETANKEIE